MSNTRDRALRTRTIIWAWMLAAALVVVVAGPSDARPESSVSGTEIAGIGFFIEGDDYTLVSGPLFEQGCIDEGFTDTLVRLRVTPAGVTTVNTSQKSEDIFLIEGPFWPALEAACSAIAAGQESPVAYLGIGEGRTSHTIVEKAASVRLKTTITGWLRTADGGLVHVTAHETFAAVVTDDGVEGRVITGKVLVH